MQAAEAPRREGKGGRERRVSVSDLVTQFETRIEAASESGREEAAAASQRSYGGSPRANGTNEAPGEDKSGASLASSAGEADGAPETRASAPAPSKRDSEVSVTLQDIIDSPDARSHAFRAAAEDADEEATRTAVVALRQANEGLKQAMEASTRREEELEEENERLRRELDRARAQTDEERPERGPGSLEEEVVALGRRAAAEVGVAEEDSGASVTEARAALEVLAAALDAGVVVPRGMEPTEAQLSMSFLDRSLEGDGFGEERGSPIEASRGPPADDARLSRLEEMISALWQQQQEQQQQQQQQQHQQQQQQVYPEPYSSEQQQQQLQQQQQVYPEPHISEQQQQQQQQPAFPKQSPLEYEANQQLQQLQQQQLADAQDLGQPYEQAQAQVLGWNGADAPSAAVQAYGTAGVQQEASSDGALAWAGVGDSAQWQRAVDPASGAVYWYNASTGESQWEATGDAFAFDLDGSVRSPAQDSSIAPGDRSSAVWGSFFANALRATEEASANDPAKPPITPSSSDADSSEQRSSAAIARDEGRRDRQRRRENGVRIRRRRRRVEGFVRRRGFPLRGDSSEETSSGLVSHRLRARTRSGSPSTEEEEDGGSFSSARVLRKPVSTEEEEEDEEDEDEEDEDEDEDEDEEDVDDKEEEEEEENDEGGWLSRMLARLSSRGQGHSSKATVAHLGHDSTAFHWDEGRQRWVFDDSQQQGADHSSTSTSRQRQGRAPPPKSNAGGGRKQSLRRVRDRYVDVLQPGGERE